ncbi:NBAS subunit of NRZ tethering complex isoform X2 [Melanerpes formicivorus]|uniref:NBAS subunit of NRZ tethering complex isoform X2 n=1 Tax=Melanerpes formicivorus TaxID=211600 RepID=UPI00358F0EA5
MFKGKGSTPYHATDSTWSKWMALITQRARMGNLERPGLVEVISNWPEGTNCAKPPQEKVTHAEDAPPYNDLSHDEKKYALFMDGSCCLVGDKLRWKSAVWSPTCRAAEAKDGEGESSQFAEVIAVQLALDMDERERWPKLYLYTDSWMVANALWGWLKNWKKSGWQRKGKPIWAADLWQDIADRIERIPVKVRHIDAHIPKSKATEEQQHNHQADLAARVSQVDMDSNLDLNWKHREKGVNPPQWSKYKYGEAWQIDYITLPHSRSGKQYVLTMVEANTGWLETYPVPHATARNTILSLERDPVETRAS